MTSVLHQLADAVVESCRREDFITLSEGLVKIRCLETALSLGWTIQEGVGNSGIADYATLVAGRISWSRRGRIAQLPSGSSDVAIVKPFTLLLEIKTRPDHGTKSQAQFQAMDEDVTRVASLSQTAFFFLFGKKAYLSFSGEKIETRGRKSFASEWFTKWFVPIDEIPSDQWLSKVAPRSDTEVCLEFRRCQHDRTDDSILVIGARRDSIALRELNDTEALGAPTS